MVNILVTISYRFLFNTSLGNMAKRPWFEMPLDPWLLDTTPPHTVVRASTNPLQAVLLALRLTGRLPFTLVEGNFGFKLWSWSTVYCVVFTTTQLVLAVDIVIWLSSIPVLWKDFEMAISTVTALVVLGFVVHPVLFTWAETPNIAAAVARWLTFLTSFKRVVDRPITSAMLDHTVIGVLLMTLFAVFVECLPIFLSLVKCPPKIIIVYGMIYIYLNMLSYFWLLFTHLVSRTATLLKDSLVQNIKCARGRSSVRVLQEHRDLWVELNLFTSGMIKAIANTLRAWETLMVLSLVTSLFQTASGFAKRKKLDVPALVQGLHSVVNISLLHSASHWADMSIRTEFLKTMLSCNLKHFREDQFNEIEILLFAIEGSKNNFILDGMVDFTRNSILDIIETVLTILVILVQFDSSIY